ncbi:MAG: hypothetical protein ACOC93_00835 [Planctomycetota bacterium]
MAQKHNSTSRTWLAAAIVATLLVLLGAGVTAWYVLVRHTVWTDGDQLARSGGQARVRKVLWEPPQALPGEINSSEQEYEPAVSADGKQMLFVRGQPGEGADIYTARRTSDGWSDPQPVSELNTPHDELGPRLTGDGEFLLFYSNRPGGYGRFDIWASRRGPDGWETPFNLGESVNSEWDEYSPAITPDGRRLLFASNRHAMQGQSSQPWDATIRRQVAVNYDLFEAQAAPDAASPLTFQRARAIDELNTPHHEGACSVSPAGDFLYFASNRPGGLGGLDLYRCRLSDDGFAELENLGSEVNSAANETDPALEMGGFALMFSSDRGGERQYDLFRAESREVYALRRGQELPGLGWHWWLLLIALAALVPLLLFLRAVGYRHLPLIQKCAFASLMLHVLIAILLSLLLVSRDVYQYVAEDGGMEMAVNPEISREVELRLDVRKQQSDLPAETPDLPPVEQTREVSPPRQRSELPELEMPPANVAPSQMAIRIPQRRKPQRPQSDAAKPELPRPHPAPVEVEFERKAAIRQAERRPEEPTAQPSEPARRQVPAQMLRSQQVQVEPMTADEAPERARLAQVERQHTPPDVREPPRPADAPPQPSEVDASPVDEPPRRVTQAEPTPQAVEQRAVSPRVAVGAAWEKPAPTDPNTPRTVAQAEPAALADRRAPRRARQAEPDRPQDAPEQFEPVPVADIGPVGPRVVAAEKTVPEAENRMAAARRRQVGPAETARREVDPGAPRTEATAGPAEIRDQQSPDRRAATRAEPTPTDAPEPAEIAVAPMTPQRVARRPAEDRPQPAPAIAAPQPRRLRAVSSTRRAPAKTPYLAAPTAADPVRLRAPSAAQRTKAPDRPVPRQMDLPFSEVLPPGSLASPESLAHRSFEQRQKLLAEMGGSEETEAAVARALAFLARNQEPDGRWTVFRLRHPLKPGRRNRNQHDVALTGLASLAFLGADHTPGKPGPYREHLTKSMAYLLQRQKDSGDLRGGGDMYDHGIATLALAEAAVMTDDVRYRKAALAGARFILEAQGQDGGWRYKPGQHGDTSVVGWQVMALHSARRAGLKLPREVVQRTFRYFHHVSRGRHGMIAGYQKGTRHDQVMTAEAAFSRVLLGETFSAPQRSEVTGKLLKNLPHKGGRRNYYYWYYGSLAMMQLQGESWEKWNRETRDLLVSLQQTGGKTDGAWSADSTRWSNRGGAVCSTALATLTLEVYYRYLPMYRRGQ